MNKKNLAVMGLILVNAIVFAFLVDRLSENLERKTRQSYTAQGIDAYLEEIK